MPDHRRAYGLDIETDTARGGLDPRRCRILAVAVADGAGAEVFTGPEARLLAALDAHLAALPAGLIVTWNGSAFDLPFLADRAARCGVDVGLRLALDPGVERSHPPLAGHAGWYRASWYAHRHLDAYTAYRSLVAGPGVSCGLKAVARRAGLEPVEVDPARIHQLSPRELAAYVASDAALTRQLALARWEETAAFADPPVPGDAPARVALGAAG